MAREWTDDEVSAEIRAAVDIVRKDKERAEYTRLHGLYGSGEGDPPSDPDDPNKPPPKKDKTEPEPKRRSLWWGDEK